LRYQSCEKKSADTNATEHSAHTTAISMSKDGEICGCSVYFRNGVNVEGATHKQVVDLIRSGGDRLVLTGI